MQNDEKQPTVASPIEPVVMCTVPVDLIKAVAHIGVDFGYGEYALPQEYIDVAREIYEKKLKIKYT